MINPNTTGGVKATTPSSKEPNKPQSDEKGRKQPKK